MTKPQKILTRNWLDRIFVPRSIDDLELCTAVRTSCTSQTLGTILCWGVYIFLNEIQEAKIVAWGFTAMTILVLVAIRLGFHRFGRMVMYPTCSLSYVAWSQCFSANSFIWVLIVHQMIGVAFYTTAAEKNMRQTMRATSIVCLVVTFVLYLTHAFEFTYSPKMQSHIIILAYMAVAWVLFELFKSVVSYQKQVNISQQQLQAQAVAMLQQAKMSSLGEMAGGVAHEINNPLAMINGHITQMLREMKATRQVSDKVLEKGEKIQDTVTRISKIVSALRAFSRNADEDPLQKCELSDIVSDTMNLCSEKLKADKIEIKTVGHQNSFIYCRPTQITQVLVSLINNSSEAVHNLSEKWIELKIVEMASGGLQIMVTDSGKGISEAVAEKLMQPFFTTKEIGKGTGLGLSVSKGIIEGHGGVIRLDRKCPNTCFVIELPAHGASADPQKIASAS